MSRNGQPAHALQLFPFLAVLVCVMGALIFLLLLTTWRICEQTVARARAEQFGAVAISAKEAIDAEPFDPESITTAETPTTIPIPPANAEPNHVAPVAEPDPHVAFQARRGELLAQLAERSERRDRQSAAVQQQQLFVDAANKRSFTLQAELRNLERQLGTATGQITAARMSVPKFDAERYQLEQEILQLRRRLKQADQARHSAEGKFAIVPYEGKSGTTRRPILIECTDTGFRFLPEDVVIRPSDVEGFTEQCNPLLAGVTALAGYWQRQSDSSDPSSEPYVLLLVRPSGPLAFYVSQRLLSRFNQPFGYELIADDVVLQLPEVEPGARVACDVAVQKLLAERGAMVDAGTPAPIDASAGSSSVGGRSAGPIDGDRRGSGTAPRANFTGSDVDGPTGIGDRSWEHVERFEGQEHRRAGAGPSLDAAPPNAQAVDRAPRRLTENGAPATEAPGVPATAQPAVPGGSLRGVADPPVTTAEFEEPNLPSFASRRASRPGDRTLPYEQLQRRRWGKYGGDATIGLEHDVLIRVEAQRLIVDNTFAIPVPAGLSRTDLFDRLLAVIDRQANGWGVAPNGFFWVPSLKFVISPGGNPVYDRIAPLVAKSGLVAKTEFMREAATDAAPVR